MNSCVMALGVSSFKKWWETLSDRIFTDQSYENLNENSLFSVPLIVIGIFVGVAIALIVNVFTKRVLGEMVRKLLAEEVTSEASAKLCRLSSVSGAICIISRISQENSTRRERPP